MKHLKVALLALLLVTSFSNVNAQDENNPWAVGFGVNAVDFYPTNPQTNWGGNWMNEFVNAEDHWNMIPAISRLTVGRYISKGFSVEVDGSFNQISQMGDMEVNDLAYWGIDGVVKWSIGSVADLGWWEPYLLVGGGYTWVGDYDTAAVNGGVGMNFWFNDKVGLNLESKLRQTFESELKGHFQHSLGIIFKMGGKDTDGDGIYDKQDACPEVFGLAEFDGCPDTDGDGIIDSADACPTVAGLAEFNGCPDTDGDGIVDKDDKCPTEAGPASNQGCPVVVEEVVVPEGISNDDLAKIDELAKGVYFKVNSSKFTEEKPSRLDQIAEIIKTNPNEEFVVNGYCDSTGAEAYNDKLSEARAATVRDYLISKGVDTNKIFTKGYGESNPVGDNASAKGRAANRRVEIKLSK